MSLSADCVELAANRFHLAYTYSARLTATYHREYCATCYGGRPYRVERKADPNPVVISRLVISVYGGTRILCVSPGRNPPPTRLFRSRATSS